MEQPINFDLSVLPVQERFAIWHDSGSLIFRPLRLAGSGDHELSVQAQIRQLGDVVIGRMASSKQAYERTEAMIKRDQVDSFHLILFEDGDAESDGEGETLRAGPGDLVFFDASQASRQRWSAHRIMFANFPRDSLLPLEAPRQFAKAGVMRASHPCAKVLAQHIKTVWDCQLSGTDGACRRLGLGLTELVKAYFQEHSLPTSLSNSAEGHGVLSKSIQNWMKQNMHRSDLNAALIGSHFHLSRSSIYALFKPYGGLSTYLRTMRLEVAHEVLQSAAGRKVSIGQLAAHLGFSSMSVFSRAFRDQYGESPREVKARSLQRYQDVMGTTSIAAPRVGLPSQWHQLQQGCASYYGTFRRAAS